MLLIKSMEVNLLQILTSDMFAKKQIEGRKRSLEMVSIDNQPVTLMYPLPTLEEEALRNRSSTDPMDIGKANA